MYIISNACKNLVRNKGRNLLIGLIILVVIISTAVSLIIRSTTKEILREHKEKYGSYVTLQADFQTLLITDPEKVIAWPTGNDLIEYGKSDHLKEVVYEGMVHGFLDGFHSPYIKSSHQNSSEEERPKAFFSGTDQRPINEFFTSGVYKIVSGRQYEQIGECVIEKEFADSNHLSVGESFPVTVKHQGYMSNNTKVMTFIIAGIYENYMTVGMGDIDRSEQPIEIYVSTQTMIEMSMLNMNAETDLVPIFYLKNPDLLEAYTKELREKGLPEEILVKTDEASYKKVVGPVEGMTKIVTTFMMIFVLIGCVVLLVVSMLNIRERKYEIGVLRAMGMSKTKVSLGLVYESLIIALICLVIGLGSGAAAAQPIADILLEKQIAATEVNNSMVQFIPVDAGETEPLSQLEITLDWSAVAGISGIVLLLVLVPAAVSIRYVTRYEPSQILAERN